VVGEDGYGKHILTAHSAPRPSQVGLRDAALVPRRACRAVELTLVGNPVAEPEAVVISVAMTDAAVTLALDVSLKTSKPLLPPALVGSPTPARQRLQASTSLRVECSFPVCLTLNVYPQVELAPILAVAPGNPRVSLALHEPPEAGKAFLSVGFEDLPDPAIAASVLPVPQAISSCPRSVRPNPLTVSLTASGRAETASFGSEDWGASHPATRATRRQHARGLSEAGSRRRGHRASAWPSGQADPS
jgi:hypothetical protein